VGEQAIAPDLGAAEEQNVFGRQVTFNIGCDRRGFSAAMSALLNTPFVSLLAVRALVGRLQGYRHRRIFRRRRTLTTASVVNSQLPISNLQRGSSGRLRVARWAMGLDGVE